MLQTRSLPQPVTDAEHLQLLIELRILREYQTSIRRVLPQLSRHTELLRVKEALPHVRRILEYGGEGLGRAPQLRQRQQEQLREWERREKLHLASRIGPADQVGRLLKLATILSSVKNQLN